MAKGRAARSASAAVALGTTASALTNTAASLGSTAYSIGEYIRGQRELANISLRKMAEQSGISATVLQEIESGLRNPSNTLLTSIARALRLSAETLQLQAGVIDPRDVGSPDVVKEVRRDPHLTDRQRDILIEIYETFCAINRTPRRARK